MRWQPLTLIVSLLLNRNATHTSSPRYLGGNAITVVEGIHELTALQELHLENQDLPAGEKLVFDPRTCLALSRTLLVLNVAGNRLDDLSDLANLRCLLHLNVSDNFIRSFRQLAKVLRRNELLQRLAIAGNPMSHTKRIRERVIPLCPMLEVFDSETVTPIQRRFMTNWEEARKLRRAKKEATSKKSDAPRRLKATGKFAAVPVPRFPSKLSSSNPHWLPPLPKIKAVKVDVRMSASGRGASRRGLKA
jgi:Leucine-rich repeat (LRR) protein